MHDFGCAEVPPVAWSCRCQSCLPVFASKHKTCSRSSRMPELQVTYTRSPNTTGDDTPRAGSGAFHFCPLSLLHSVGRFFSEETPVAFGPLNCDHSAADSVRVSASVSVSETARKERI